MIPFNFIKAQSLEDALQFLKEHGETTRIIAGGTDLLVELRGMKVGEAGAPEFVLDITSLDDLRGIRGEKGEVIIGPLSTHREVASSEIIKRSAPLLAQACSTVGAMQHRAAGTIGGNIINASPAADSVPALVALEAAVTFASAGGERRALVKDIFVKPYQTDIRPDELLIEIRFAKLPPGARTTFIKLARRNALAISRMNVAVVVILEGKTISDIRISPGSTTPLPDRVGIAEAVLRGRQPSEELITEAGRKVSEEMINRSGVRWSTPYKQPVIEALTARALRRALGWEK